MNLNLFEMLQDEISVKKIGSTTAILNLKVKGIWH